MGGRINHPHLPSSINRIIILKSHPIAKLLVKECHEKNFHIGREHTLATVRKKIWIPACRGLIRKGLHDCLYCKRELIKPHVPLMSDLPQDRLEINEKPFQSTGIGFFGPILVKLSKKTRANQVNAKCYGAIFTCMTTRPVHLEIAGDLSSDSFILSLRRFIARRGTTEQTL